MGTNPDTIYSDMRTRFLAGETLDWEAKRAELAKAVRSDVQNSKLFHVISGLREATGGDKDIAVFDYGCGGGMLVLYLLLDGYRDARGIDVGDTGSADAFVRTVLGEEGGEPRLRTYDGHKLPYADESFDAMTSVMVLEHVQDLPAYYAEAARVLKPGGPALLNFMHRLEPFDTHARRWFIHYFPAPVRRLLYNACTEAGCEYYGKLLNLRTLGGHRALALRSFSEFKDMTKERLRNFKYAKHRYEGNLTARKVVDALVNLPVVGEAFLSMLSPLAGADIRLRK